LNELGTGNDVQKTRLYIDVDGVILRRSGEQAFNGRREFEVAHRAVEFLEWASATFDCYWLSARSPNGSVSNIKRGFNHAIPTTRLPQQLHDTIDRIPAATWQTAKYTGIELTMPFYWIDDMPDPASCAKLEQRGLLDRLIICNVDAHPDDLTRVWALLQSSIETTEAN